MELHNIPNKARNYRSLRLSDYLRHLPEEVRQRTIDVLFLEESEAVGPGQWVDNGGVMVLATVLYLQRDILVYSQTSADTEEVSVTRIEGRGRLQASL